MTAALWTGFTRKLQPKAPVPMEALDPMVRLPDS
jgi:hypothetical protein